jgi:hypothetical protein
MTEPWDRQAAWCIEHDSLAELWDDGSGQCFYACNVEIGSSECRFVALPKRVQAAIEAVRSHD